MDAEPANADPGAAAVPRDRAVASPVSTGGGGTITEYRLGAVALVALLLGDRLPGIDVPIERVGFQQASTGHALDDVVLSGTSGAGESVSVDYQSKRSIRPTASETDFVEVMVAVVRTMRADRKGITQRLHRVGLAARLPRGPLEELRIVASLAYGSADSATFLELLRAGGITRVFATGSTSCAGRFVSRSPGSESEPQTKRLFRTLAGRSRRL